MLNMRSGSTAASMPTVEVKVKVRFENGDIRRFSIAPREASFATLRSKVGALSGQERPWTFRYNDGGDLVTIANDQDLLEALRELQRLQAREGVPAGSPVTLDVSAVEQGRPSSAPPIADHLMLGEPPRYEALPGLQHPTMHRHVQDMLNRIPAHQGLLHVVTEPFIQAGYHLVNEMRPTIDRILAFGLYLGVTAAERWRQQLHAYSTPQLFVMTGLTVFFIGSPLLSVVSGVFGLVPPLLYLGWNAVLLRLALAAVGRVSGLFPEPRIVPPPAGTASAPPYSGPARPATASESRSPVN